MFRLSRKIPSSSFNQETHLGLSLSFAQDVAPANQTTRFEEVDPLLFYYSLTYHIKQREWFLNPQKRNWRGRRSMQVITVMMGWRED